MSETSVQILSVGVVVIVVLATVVSGIPAVPVPDAENQSSEMGQTERLQVTGSNGSETLTSGDGPARLEIRSTAENDEFSYRFVVNGTVAKTQVGESGIAADADDSVTEHDNGTVTVVGTTGAGAGDAYLFEGRIISSAVRGSDTYQVTLGRDVAAEFGDVPDVHGLEIIPRDQESRYQVEVSGDIEPADINERSVNPDDSIEGNTATGSVYPGFEGDSYRFTGDYEITLLEGDARFLLDGEEVSPGTEPQVQYINCSAAEVTGNYDYIEIGSYWNNNYGVDTAVRSYSKAQVENLSGTISSDAIWGETSVNGTILDYVSVKDEDGNEIVSEEPPSEDCGTWVRPNIEFEVSDTTIVESPRYHPQLGVSFRPYLMNFTYTNPHDEPLSFPDQHLDGNALLVSGDQLPTTLEPGQHSFSVWWFPVNNDRQLTWEIDPVSWAGYEDSISVQTDPASEYGGVPRIITKDQFETRINQLHPTSVETVEETENHRSIQIEGESGDGIIEVRSNDTIFYHEEGQRWKVDAAVSEFDIVRPTSSEETARNETETIEQAEESNTAIQSISQSDDETYEITLSVDRSAPSGAIEKGEVVEEESLIATLQLIVRGYLIYRCVMRNLPEGERDAYDYILAFAVCEGLSLIGDIVSQEAPGTQSEPTATTESPTSTDTPIDTPTVTESPTPVDTPTETPSPTESPTATETPSPTEPPTATETSTSTPMPAEVQPVTETETPAPNETATPTSTSAG